MNILKTIELYMLNGQIVHFVNYFLIKLLWKIEWSEASRV